MKTRVIAAFILILVLAFLTGCAGKRVELDRKQSQAWLEEGLACMWRGEAPQALEKFQHAQKLDPENAEIPNAIGLIYYSMEKYEKAIIAYKQAQELDDTFSDAYHNLGTLYITLGRYDDAIAEFEKAISNDLYVNKLRSLNNMGWAYYQKGDLEQAQKWLQEAIRLNPLFVLAYCNMGQVLIRQEQYKEAINYLEKAVEYSPRYAEAFLHLGIAALKAGDTAKAEESFKKAQMVDPYGKFGAKAQEYLEILPR